MTSSIRTRVGRPLARALLTTYVLLIAWAALPVSAQAVYPGTNGKLSFSSARNGFPADSDLYTMDAAGTNQLRITSLDQDEVYPAWSPDGLKIAYERNTGMRSDIWVANADGSNRVQLTTAPPTTRARPGTTRPLRSCSRATATAAEECTTSS